MTFVLSLRCSSGFSVPTSLVERWRMNHHLLLGVGLDLIICELLLDVGQDQSTVRPACGL